MINKKSNDLIAIFLILGIFLIKYTATYYLFNNKLSLFVDEAQYWLWSENLAFGYYSKPPLLALIIKTFAYFFGDTEIALKSISNFCIAIASWFIFKLTTKLYSERAGLISIILFSLMPIAIFGSFFITTDLPLIMFWSISLYVLQLALNEQKKQYWLMLGILIGLGILTKYTFVYFYMCLFLYLIIFARSNLKLSKYNILLSVIATIIVVSPNIYWNIENGLVTFKHVVNENIEIHKRIYNPLNGLWFLAEQIVALGIFNFCILCFGFYKKLYKDKNQQFLLCFDIYINFNASNHE